MGVRAWMEQFHSCADRPYPEWKAESPGIAALSCGMTNVEEWKAKQAEMGEVSVRLKPSYHALMVRLYSETPDTFSTPIKALAAIQIGSDRVVPVICADRWGRFSSNGGDILVELPNGSFESFHAPSEVEFVVGSARKVYRPGRFRVGTTGSAMGAVCKGIRTGRAFRGR